MWSKGNLGRGFAPGDFRMCYCTSGFRACGLKLSNLPFALPNHPRYQLRYTRLSRFHSPGSFRGFFVSVGIPVVNRKFPTKSNPRQSDLFARVSRRSGRSRPARWMPLSIVPNVARYQLRYTRLTCYSSAQATFYHTRFRYAMLFSLRFAPVYAKLVSYLIFHH